MIDDEVQIRRLLAVTLTAGGYRVCEARDGGYGLNEAAVQRPDAVVLDLSLPDMTGLDVLTRLREWSNPIRREPRIAQITRTSGS